MARIRGQDRGKVRDMRNPHAEPDGARCLLAAPRPAVQEQAAAATAAELTHVDRLRVLLLLRALSVGGVERQAIQMARGLALRGHRVRVAAFYPAALDHELPGPNPDLLVVGKRGRGDIARFGWRLGRSAAVWRPDLVYSFLPVPNLVAGMLRPLFWRRVALVWGVRGTPLEVARYDWLQRVSLRLEQLASRLPDLVIANSEAGAAWAEGPRFGARRVVAIGNGIDTGRFRPASLVERADARAVLGIPAAVPAIAVVARLDPMKDHSTFLQALAIAADADPDLVAIIAGDGPPSVRARLEAEAGALGIAGRLVWVAAPPDVRTIYAAADLLCLPSAFGEGFPNVVGEAMACGLLCVVTQVGDSARVVGETGWVVAPRNPQVLAAALLDCLRSIRENPGLKLAARRRIIDNFALEAMISATDRALVQAVAQRRCCNVTVRPAGAR